MDHWHHVPEASMRQLINKSKRPANNVKALPFNMATENVDLVHESRSTFAHGRTTKIK